MSLPTETSPYTDTKPIHLQKLEVFWIKLNQELKDCYGRLRRIEQSLNKSIEAQDSFKKGRNYFDQLKTGSSA